MSLPVPRALRTPAIVIVGLAVILTVSLAAGRARIVGVGQTVQIDDFFFTVRDVQRKAPPVMGAGTTSERVEYVVTVTIDNRARRVPFRFNNQALVLIDTDGGKAYRVDTARQRAHEEAHGGPQPDPLVLKPGESATRDYVFAVPVDVIAPRLKPMPGGVFGDTVDKVLGVYTEIQLP
jgi:hypothetical protein